MRHGPPVGTPRTLQAPFVPRGRYYFGATGPEGRYYVDAHSKAACDRKRASHIARGARAVGKVMDRGLS